MLLTRRLSLLKKYNQQIFPDQKAKLLDNLCIYWAKTQPLKGKTILHIIPVSYETLVKIESLVASGAEVSIAHPRNLNIPPPSVEIISLLKQLEIPYLAGEICGEFDLALDCGAQITDLTKVKIKRGIVELTQTGGQKYKKFMTKYPVIDIDESNLKKLENSYGTGEGCVRALKELLQDTLTGKHIMVLGCGKVGLGIMRYLLNEKAVITGIDINRENLKMLEVLSIQGLHVSQRKEIQEQARRSFCIITATGKKNVLRKLISPQDCSNAYIANMGAEDEIGEGFDHVLGKGVAINFLLKHPTLLPYIDPVFFAHNLSAQLLIEQQYSPGYHPFPSYLDFLIIKLWEAEYSAKIDNLYSM